MVDLQGARYIRATFSDGSKAITTDVFLEKNEHEKSKAIFERLKNEDKTGQVIYLKKIASVLEDTEEGAHCILWDVPPATPKAAAPCLTDMESAQVHPLSGVTYLTYPAGILDIELWQSIDAIAQQTNCIGCNGAGLAQSLAQALPYGDPYCRKRPILPKKKFAIPEDRSVPGTISIHLPWGGKVEGGTDGRQHVRTMGVGTSTKIQPYTVP